MLIYLASPYSHPDKAIQAERFEAVLDKCAELMNQGHFIYSPIVHGHPIAVKHSLPTTWEYWRDYCRAFVSKCDELWVYCIPGYEDSTGVKGEIEIAKELGIPVKYIPANYEIL